MSKKNKFLFSIIAFIVIFFITITVLLLLNRVDTDSSLDKIMNKLYSSVSKKEMPDVINDIEVTDDKKRIYLGTKNISYNSSLSRSAVLSNEAHNVILIRANNKGEVEDLKETLNKSINPKRWVIYGVEDDELVIESNNDLILIVLVKNKNIRNKIVKEFKKL